ncbi:hypothetical protein KEJ18_01815 [Candidatus Bathyarchaeota archaeon]|nr:hypothetical protein [Candidatus Bathyarchaeota archaeon]
MSFERQGNTTIQITAQKQTPFFSELQESLPISLNEYYRCHHCNYLIPKKGALISGYDSENSLQHIHCTNCGRIVTWSPGGSKIRSMAEGLFLMVTGGIMAFLFYPFLNIYGLQAGFTTSLFGIIKALFL